MLSKTQASLLPSLVLQSSESGRTAAFAKEWEYQQEMRCGRVREGTEDVEGDSG